MFKRALITDGDYRHTLAMIRAVCRECEVHVGSERRMACGFYSKFVKGRMLYNIDSPESFVKSINRYLRNERIDVLLPVGDTCFFYSSLLKNNIAATVPVADIESMQIARNKVKMAERARKVGFNVPKIVETPDRFPVVFRPVSGRGNLRFVNNQKEFSEAKNFSKREKFLSLLQNTLKEKKTILSRVYSMKEN
jgi:carbamoylphosphate synthase large subunit